MLVFLLCFYLVDAWRMIHTTIRHDIIIIQSHIITDTTIVLCAIRIMNGIHIRTDIILVAFVIDISNQFIYDVKHG